MEDQELQENYKTWVKSPVAADLLTYLEQEFQGAMDSAIEELEPIKAVGLLQKANAYRTIRSYIERMSS